VETTISIQVSNNSNCRVANVLFERRHMQLPLEVLRKRRRSGKKLLEGGSVFLVLNFLGLVPGIKIVLKLPAKINFLKSIARAFFGKTVLACYLFTLLASVIALSQVVGRSSQRHGFSVARSISSSAASFRRSSFEICISVRARQMVQYFFG